MAKWNVEECRNMSRGVFEWWIVRGRATHSVVASEAEAVRLATELNQGKTPTVSPYPRLKLA